MLARGELEVGGPRARRLARNAQLARVQGKGPSLEAAAAAAKRRGGAPGARPGTSEPLGLRRAELRKFRPGSVLDQGRRGGPAVGAATGRSSMFSKSTSSLGARALRVRRVRGDAVLRRRRRRAADLEAHQLGQAQRAGLPQRGLGAPRDQGADALRAHAARGAVVGLRAPAPAGDEGRQVALSLTIYLVCGKMRVSPRARPRAPPPPRRRRRRRRRRRAPRRGSGSARRCS